MKMIKELGHFLRKSFKVKIKITVGNLMDVYETMNIVKKLE